MQESSPTKTAVTNDNAMTSEKLASDTAFSLVLYQPILSTASHQKSQSNDINFSKTNYFKTKQKQLLPNSSSLGSFEDIKGKMLFYCFR